ncbi:MAG: hypothetical protein OEV85_13110 [Candidatus Thorarchaeota archaeon]|nr:hypothetical protein [Candidatus Thorarchaeota archaeon]
MVFNNSELVGDHVILNATFLGQEGFLEPYEMTLNITGLNSMISTTTNSIVYDTYPSRFNFTTSLIIRIDNGINSTILRTFDNLSICNFFKPKVTVNPPVEVSPDYFNISWSSTDKNSNDTNYYSIWLSIDGGASFMLLQQNTTATFFLWNSTGWLDHDYTVRIRAFSVDLTYFGGPFVDIPTDYWPGDYSDGYWFAFTHDGPFGTVDIGVFPASDLFYFRGSVNNQIEWHLMIEHPGFPPKRIPEVIDYEVVHNGNSFINGTQSIGADYQYTYITIQIDGLDVGTHNFTLTFSNPGDSGGIVVDNVQVTVWLNFEIYIAVGAGLSVLILMVIALVTKSKRR